MTRRTRRSLRPTLTLLSLWMCLDAARAADWQPAEGPLMTRWAADVSPDDALKEYPRPQLRRDKWLNLNGLWDYCVTPKADGLPTGRTAPIIGWKGKILVPFPIESALSGVGKHVGTDNRLWYHRTFAAPKLEKDGRLLLHFGAVDWQCEVWVNGKRIGEHAGGYDPFTIDITEALHPSADADPSTGAEEPIEARRPEELTIAVWDPTDAHWQPRGKQVRNPHGIWYTSVTGIWQTVWLEPVPKTYISGLTITPDLGQSRVRVTVNAKGADPDANVKVIVQTKDRELADVTGKAGQELAVEIPDVRAWSPDDPFLYNLSVVLEPTSDVVTSYFGMRKIEVKKDADGFNRLFLNNEPLFQYGPLDQGWWPDGLYTAPTDEALRYDIEVTKRLGMNMARKHVKVEPARWYYWCDKLGLMVWQDMPSGDRSIGRDNPDLERTPESAETYHRELKAIIDARGNHPCIVAWVPFNEGWGQFETDAILKWTQEYDPTRLVDGPSGWADRGSGNMHDMHRYPGPGMPQPEEGRAVVLGEFGGLGWPVEGHLWQNKENWGYRSYESQAALQENYEILMHKLRPLIPRGLAAAVYTQTTDVEGEVNGLMTYDRAVLKLDVERVRELHERLYEPPPLSEVRTILPTSEKEGQKWRYTTQAPEGNWTAAGFDDSAWQSGVGGFGREDTPGAVVRTLWTANDIWIRRTFAVDELKGRPHLRVHHDEDAEVYVNAQRAVSLTGYTTDYFDMELPRTALKTLHSGENIIAVHCKQTGGGQYIDVGLLDVTETPR